MSSIDKNFRDRNEQGKEISGEKKKTGWTQGSGSRSQIDRINQELSKSNLTPQARKALEEKKKKLLGS